MKKKLKNPVFVSRDWDEPPIRCETFGEYARWMMYPDPTYVILPEETEELIADMINCGEVNIFDALRAVSHDYHYDDEGREYIEFPKPTKMRQLLQQSTEF